MLNKNLIELFARDLNKLIKEIELYSTEDNLWKVSEGISNSAGNLTLHIIGNLNTFIGATLGNTGYQRNREAEFSSKNVPRATIIEQLNNTINVIESTLSKITEHDMEKNFPVVVFKEKGETSTAYFLMHLSTHLNYHLGQINYHRRLLDQ